VIQLLQSTRCLCHTTHCPRHASSPPLPLRILMQECMIHWDQSSVISPATLVLFAVACSVILCLSRLQTANTELKLRLNKLEHVMTDLLHAVRLLQPTSESLSQQPELDKTLATDSVERCKPTGVGETYCRDAGSQTKLQKNWTGGVCNCTGEADKLLSTSLVAASCYADSPRGPFRSSQSKHLTVDETPRMRHFSSGSLDYLK